MSKFLFKITDRNPVHVRVAVYAGPADRSTLGLCGNLCFRVEEWDDFSGVLGIPLLDAEIVEPAQQELVVIDDFSEIVEFVHEDDV